MKSTQMEVREFPTYGTKNENILILSSTNFEVFCVAQNVWSFVIVNN